MLMQDKDAIAELQAMIEDILVEPRLEKKFNQVRKKFKNWPRVEDDCTNR